MLTKSTKLPLPPSLTERLEQAAERMGSTPASIARAALNEWLTKHAPPAVPASRYADRLENYRFIITRSHSIILTMSTQTRVTLSLPPGTVRRLDRVARDAKRSRSNTVRLLLDSAFVNSRRLAELARLASETADAPDTVAAAAREAAEDHLAEHAELSGFDQAAPESDTIQTTGETL